MIWLKSIGSGYPGLQDAQLALGVVQPDQVLTSNVKPAADAMLEQIKRSGMECPDVIKEDFLLGNIKPRQRMVAQYAFSGALRFFWSLGAACTDAYFSLAPFIGAVPGLLLFGEPATPQFVLAGGRPAYG